MPRKLSPATGASLGLALTVSPNKSVQQHLRVGQKTHLRTMEVPEMGYLGPMG